MAYHSFSSLLAVFGGQVGKSSSLISYPESSKPKGPLASVLKAFPRAPLGIVGKTFPFRSIGHPVLRPILAA
eukprot:Skav229610  [mRNA]  locus=scaffold510:260494:260709:- [translate_table: standard]